MEGCVLEFALHWLHTCEQEHIQGHGRQSITILIVSVDEFLLHLFGFALLGELAM